MPRNKNTLKSDICRAYRDKYGMEMNISALARKMYSENVVVFGCQV